MRESFELSLPRIPQSAWQSIFLILRRVVSAPGLLPTPEFSPEGRTLATYLASAEHDLCGKPIPPPLKCHSAGIGTSVPTGNTDACRRSDCASRREPATELWANASWAWWPNLALDAHAVDPGYSGEITEDQRSRAICRRWTVAE